MPDINEKLLSILIEEVKGITLEVASIKQTIHGPPESENGMYRDVKWVKEQMLTDVLPFIEHQRNTKKVGMSRREKFWFILLASVVSGVVGVIVSLINFGGA